MRRISATLAASATLLGAVVLIGGWALDIAVLRTVSPQLQAGLSRTTAMSFVLLGIATFLLASKYGGRRLIIAVGRASAIIVAAIALGDLIALTLGVPGGLEALIFSASSQTATIYMSPATAIDFLAAAACLSLLIASSQRAARYFSVLATFGLVTALTALAGYVYDASALYSVSFFTAMAVHTAAGFALLFLALFCAVPEWSWMQVVVGRGEGSVTTRRLLPAILGTPFVLGWAALFAIRHDVFSLAFNISLIAIVTMALLSALLIRSGVLQNAAESALRSTNRDLQKMIAHRDLLLGEVHHRTKNNLQLVNAMLTIEAAQISDHEAQNALQRISERVQSLALVHQMLLEDANASHIDMNQFLSALCNHIERAGGIKPAHVSINVRAEPDLVDVKRAVPMGLIANELITNALRHAFTEQTSRRQIEVSYTVLASGEGELAVSDNGTGCGGFQPEKWNGVGSRIVRSLVQQLQGRMTLATATGARISIVIPR